MQAYAGILNEANRQRKEAMTGQMSLMDFLEEEEKKEFEVKYPDVGEYSKEELLAFEKEVLGVYISGHPLEDYIGLIEKNTTASSLDFLIDEETQRAKVRDGLTYTIGGMVAGKTVKLTKNNQNMAFLSLEDLFGTVEVIIFPRDYTRYREYLEEDQKLLIRGRASVSEEEGKLICEQVIPFDQVPKELWIQFSSIEEYQIQSGVLVEILEQNSGTTPVVIYCRREKARKRLDKMHHIQLNNSLIFSLYDKFDEANVKVVEKPIEKRGKRD